MLFGDSILKPLIPGKDGQTPCRLTSRETSVTMPQWTGFPRMFVVCRTSVLIARTGEGEGTMDNVKTGSTEAQEEVVYSARRHWAMVLPPFLLLVFAGLSIPSKGGQAWVLVLISLAWIALSWMNVRTAEFQVTRTRFLAKTGFPWSKSYDIPLRIIGMVDVYQPALGKVLDFGKVRLMCTDGNKRFFRMVGAPLAFTAKIREYRDALGEEK
jgi:hypothetical protein